MVRLLQVVAQLRLQKNITTEKAIGAEAVQQQSIRPDAGQVISQECLFKLLSKVIGQVLRQNAAKVHCCQSAWHQNCTRDALKLHGQLHKRHTEVMYPGGAAAWVADTTTKSKLALDKLVGKLLGLAPYGGMGALQMGS